MPVCGSGEVGLSVIYPEGSDIVETVPYSYCLHVMEKLPQDPYSFPFVRKQSPELRAS